MKPSLVCGLVLLAMPVATRVAATETPASAQPAPAPATAAASQRIAAQDVHIEGKLYSPQALFIVSRLAEDFGRDAVVPHYLHNDTPSQFLPYRLQPEVLGEAMERQRVEPGRKP